MLTNLWQRNKGAVLALGAAAIAAMSSIVIVPETQQVVVVRTAGLDRQAAALVPDGAPDRAVDRPVAA